MALRTRARDAAPACACIFSGRRRVPGGMPSCPVPRAPCGMGAARGRMPALSLCRDGRCVPLGRARPLGAGFRRRYGPAADRVTGRRRSGRLCEASPHRRRTRVIAPPGESLREEEEAAARYCVRAREESAWPGPSWGAGGVAWTQLAAAWRSVHHGCGIPGPGCRRPGPMLQAAPYQAGSHVTG